MSKPTKFDGLRTSLDRLDNVWASAPLQRNIRPIAAKREEGGDLALGFNG